MSSLLYKYVINEITRNDDITNTITLHFDNMTLEHIIPQTPNPKTNWVKDFTEHDREELTFKLGNMTLLSQKRNSSAKNYDFSKKKLVYSKTNLFITNEMADKEFIMSPDYIKERNERFSKKLKELLNF